MRRIYSFLLLVLPLACGFAYGLGGDIYHEAGWDERRDLGFQTLRLKVNSSPVLGVAPVLTGGLEWMTSGRGSWGLDDNSSFAYGGFGFLKKFEPLSLQSELRLRRRLHPSSSEFSVADFRLSAIAGNDYRFSFSGIGAQIESYADLTYSTAQSSDLILDSYLRPGIFLFESRRTALVSFLNVFGKLDSRGHYYNNALGLGLGLGAKFQDGPLTLRLLAEGRIYRYLGRAIAEEPNPYLSATKGLHFLLVGGYVL